MVLLSARFLSLCAVKRKRWEEQGLLACKVEMRKNGRLFFRKKVGCLIFKNQFMDKTSRLLSWYDGVMVLS